MVVAIDGPAGAGKSTVARLVARSLGLTYIDTGAMYRAVTWLALQRCIEPSDGTAIAALAAGTLLELSPLSEDGRQQVTVDGTDVTDAIRTPEVSLATSAVSALSPVRQVVVQLQRQMAARDSRGVVLEGRDIGTVVFPNADVKVFLTASASERARRRTDELRARGHEVDAEQVLAEQNARDAQDSGRTDSPLTVAGDAIVIETDGLGIDAVLGQILELCRRASSLGRISGKP